MVLETRDATDQQIQPGMSQSAVRLALEQNLSIQVERISPRIEDENVGIALAAFATGLAMVAAIGLARCSQQSEHSCWKFATREAASAALPHASQCSSSRF